MANLIVGHTTHDSTTIWVCGDKTYPTARVVLEPREGDDFEPVRSEPIRLRPDDDFTAATSFSGLHEDTPYRVVAYFEPFRPRWLGGEPLRIEGSLRTFPISNDRAPFSFLLGSCNLSTATLTNIGALAMGIFGAWATASSLERPVSQWRWPWLRALRRPLEWMVWKLPFLVYGATRLEQPEPLLPSPVGELNGLVRDAQPRFMIHAGDQIYFDFPFPSKTPKLEDYRRAYRLAWFEDDQYQKLLASCPHYMMLDDHEIVDGFACDRIPDFGPSQARRKPEDYLEPALRAYREYVHVRHPGKASSEALFYEFECGSACFFVLDTRTERRLGTEQMISDDQLKELEKWLVEHRDDVKFVVSSVPFVAQLKPRDDESDPRSAEPADKWAGGPFESQRQQIIAWAYEHDVRRLVFLVGDMHCSYHATMRVGTPRKRMTLHELAGGPIHQLDYSRPDAFHQEVCGTILGEVPFHASLRQFHGAASSVMHIRVSPGESSEVGWSIVRTGAKAEPLPGESTPRPRPLTGQISF